MRYHRSVQSAQSDMFSIQAKGFGPTPTIACLCVTLLRMKVLKQSPTAVADFHVSVDFSVSFLIF